MNVLADVMIIDVAQLLHFKVVLGVTDYGNDLLEQHITLDVVDHQEEAHVVQDVDHVHLVVLIKLEKLHHVALQSDFLLRLLVDPLHVHVAVFLILVVNLIDASEDLIVDVIEQFHDDDVDNQQQDSEADGVLVGVDVHVHCVCAFDLAIKVRLLAIDRKLIILLQCLDMLL